MHAFRAEQQHGHLHVGPLRKVDLVEDAVVDEGCALVFEYAGAKPVFGGVGGCEEVRHHLQHGVLTGGLQQFVGHGEVQAVGLLREGRVALPPGLGFFQRVGNLLGRLDGVEQHDVRHLDLRRPGLCQLVGYLVGDGATK